MSDLMLVESPTKVKSIGKYLHDRDMKILATKGHIRDLHKKWIPKSGKLDDIRWVVTNIEAIKEIKKAADRADKIYLSTDPDREGEAISWHVSELIGEANKKKCLRAVFNEISEKAVKRAIDNPKELDKAQVNSYLARRLLDRWLGYELSKYIRKKLGGESAGRVQSVALKFLADKEEEIKAFKKEVWFTADVILENDLQLSLCQLSKEFKDQIRTIESEDKSKVRFESSIDAENLLQKLDTFYKLDEITSPKLFFDAPPESFKTSTLFEKAINTFGMRSDMVREASQKLYEGINLGGEVVSLITYPRTDKTELSIDFAQDLRRYILSKYSDKYLQNDAPDFLNNSKQKELLVQGAHEGIRPVDLSWTPERVSKFITINSPEYKIYSLVWAYTLASFSKPSTTQTTRYFFSNQENLFVAIEHQEVFDGFKKFLREWGLMDEAEKPSAAFKELKRGESYEQKSFSIEERQNKPPRKYSEASLIKALEKKGVGRPSTYPSISKTVLKRNYAIMKEKRFEITQLGLEISKDLDENFSNFISYDYTRIMEEELDNIAQSKTNWKEFLEDLFDKWRNTKPGGSIVVGICPECKSDLVKKFVTRRNVIRGFIGCSNYPKCKYIEKEKPEEVPGKICPECSSALVKKKNRKRDSFFVACSAYPNCNYLEKEEVKCEPVEGEFCKGCSAQLVYKEYWKKPGKKFKACPNYPTCKYNTSKKSPQLLDTKCKLCDSFLKKVTTKWGKEFISCSAFPKCKYTENTQAVKKS